MSIIPNINNEALQLLPDIALWKQQIADAINYKGGEAEPTQAFTELAEEIKDIPNFDQWVRLAGVLAGNSYNKNYLQGHNENVEAGSITKLTDSFGTFTQLNNYAFQNWDLLEEIDLPFLTRLEPTKGLYAFNGCDNLRKINMPRLEFINNSNSGGSFISSPFTTQIYLPELIEIASGFAFTTYVEYFICPKLQVISSGALFGTRSESEIKNIVLGTLTMFANDAIYTTCKNLRNITIGENTDINLPFQKWTATNVIAEGQSGIDELNSNLRTNLLEKLYDHSEDGQTRTLRLGWLDYVTPENIAYATAKGWTLTT